MLITIFGLSISSSWGNGHATLWRGLANALVRKGNRIIFFEQDTSYYAKNRDFYSGEDIQIIFYESWESIVEMAYEVLNRSDVAIVTSYCPDACTAGKLITLSQAKAKLYYDMDTPVTINLIYSGTIPFYIPSEGLGNFDAVLSYTGGISLEIQKKLLLAKKTFPLYGSVDPSVHFPVNYNEDKGKMSYLGTYSPDRQNAVENLFFKPAKIYNDSLFKLCGAQYPSSVEWPANVMHSEHIEPHEHSRLYCSCQFTLNITRSAMAALGYCPSGRLFEAAACGVVIISDHWEGFGDFFDVTNEVITVTSTEDVVHSLCIPEAKRERIAKAAKDRVLRDHTSDKRADDFLSILSSI
ncbi:MAG: glycosyltransferase [Chitinispirillaceae bacterium]|nr:glycosyltransferase [Chitinispirillaceae bacterium]